MEKFFIEVAKKLLATILVSIILLTASYSFISGEFPPNLMHMKKGLAEFKTQMETLKKIQELKISQALNQEQKAPQNEQKNHSRSTELTKLMKELGMDQQENNTAQQNNQEPLSLETLEKQNIILVRKINELEYRLFMLEKKKSQDKN